MRLVIDHLTRMGGMRICVAGISRSNGHVRPLPTDGQLFRSEIPGTWALGRVLEIGATKDVGSAPRFEDREFKLANVLQIETLTPAAFWATLRDTAESDLSSLFGDDFSVNANRKGFVMPGGGVASLGILAPQDKPTLFQDYDGNPRLRLTDGSVTVDCSITDVRLRKSDNVTLVASAVTELRTLIRESNRILLSVGLTYPWPPTAPKHWLQVNNIHCSSSPLWRA